MACPTCGSFDYREMGKMENRKWVECSRCKMQYTIPLPAPREVIVVDNALDIY